MNDTKTFVSGNSSIGNFVYFYEHFYHLLILRGIQEVKPLRNTILRNNLDFAGNNIYLSLEDKIRLQAPNLTSNKNGVYLIVI